MIMRNRPQILPSASSYVRQSDSSIRIPNSNNNISISSGFCVLGLTRAINGSPLNLVGRITKKGSERFFEFPVIELANGEMKKLSSLMIELGHFDRLDRRSLLRTANKMLKKASRSKVITLSGTGIREVKWNDLSYRAFIFGGRECQDFCV